MFTGLRGSLGAVVDWNWLRVEHGDCDQIRLDSSPCLNSSAAVSGSTCSLDSINCLRTRFTHCVWLRCGNMQSPSGCLFRGISRDVIVLKNYGCPFGCPGPSVLFYGRYTCNSRLQYSARIVEHSNQYTCANCVSKLATLS